MRLIVSILVASTVVAVLWIERTLDNSLTDEECLQAIITEHAIPQLYQGEKK